MFSLLVALFLGFCEGQLYASRNLPVFTREALISKGSYYGTYGNGLSLVSDMSLLTTPFDLLPLTGSSPSALYLFELQASTASEGLKQVEMFISSFPSTQLIYSTPSECIVQTLTSTSASSRSQFSLVGRTRSLYPLIKNIISVPEQPYKPLVKPVRPYPKVTAPDPRIQAAIAGVEIPSLKASIEHLEAYHSRNSYSEGARLAQSWIAGQFLNNGGMVEYNEFQPNMSSNVLAIWPGQVTGPLIVVGAHYDSRAANSSNPLLRAPGAVDNGSGTAAILEFAKILHKSQLTPYYPIQLAVWSGEEQGLVGSRANARAREQGSVYAYFNADMLAYRLPNSTAITLGFKDRLVSIDLTESCMNISRTYVPAMEVAYSPSCCSDYQSFYEVGIPSVGFFENGGSASDYPAYHTDDDLSKWVDWTQQSLETQAVIASALTYALQDAP